MGILIVSRDEQQLAQIRKGYTTVENLIDESLKIETKCNKSIEKFTENTITLSLKFKSFVEECNRNIERVKAAGEDAK